MSIPPRALHLWCMVTLALCLAPLGALCRGAEELQADDAAPPHVVLPLQIGAQGELRTAEGLAGQGRWDLALPMLQALLDERPNGLIPDAAVYRPIASVVNRRLDAAPPETLRAYALLYEPAARKLYDQGVRERSETLLRAAASRYLHAPSGLRAAGALADLLMDQGQFEGALLVLDKTDGLSPGAPERAALSARKIICLAHLGRRKEAERIAAQLAGSGAGRLQVAGKNWEPAAFLAQVFAGLAPRSPGADAGAATSAGDASGRAPAVSFVPDVGTALSLDLPPARPLQSEVPSMPSIRALPLDGGACFVRNGVAFAVGGQAPQVRWTAQAPGLLLEAALPTGGTSEGEPLTPYFIPAPSLVQWLTYENYGMATLCAAGGRLYAVLFDPTALGFPEEPWAATPDDLRLTNQLSCLDAASGKVLWSLGGGLPMPGVPSPDYWFFSAPTVVEGRAYVLAARKGRLSALCLAADTGRVLWDWPVGPLESRQEVQRYWWELFLSDAAPPSVAGGVAVFPTGQGLVCALDAWDGSPLWVSPYARAQVLINYLGQRVNVPAGPWTARQPLISGDLCLFAPSDSRRLVALSLRSGDLLWQQEFPRGTALLGATSDRAFVQTRTALCCLDLQTGDTLWRCRLGTAAVGIGALGRGVLYVPEEDGLRPVDAASGRTGRLLRWPPGTRTWGNLAFCGDRLVAVSPDRVTICPPAGSVPDVVPVLERAVEEARSAGNTALAASAQDQLGLRLVERAVSRGEPALLQKAEAAASDRPAVQQELAIARLRLALGSPERSDVATSYLELCRRLGAQLRPGPTSSASFWTMLSALVRSECAADPELHKKCLDQFAALARQDQEARADLARWSPFAGSAQESEPPQEAAPALSGTPSDRAAWTLEGVPVLPVEPGDRADGPLLVLRTGKLLRVDPAGGSVLWETDLPAVGVAEEQASNRARPPRQLAGAGMPAYLELPSGLLVTTLSAYLLVEPDSGRIVWSQSADWPRAQMPVVWRIPRLELITRAHVGLPVPSGEGQRLRPLDAFAASSSAVCRLHAGRALEALDTVSGSKLLDLRPKDPKQTWGARIAAVGPGLAALLQEPQRLLYFDFRGRQPLAEWRLRQAGFVRSMLAGPPGALYVADYDGIYRFDLAQMTLGAKWIVDGGVDSVLCADDDMVLAATLDGRLIGLRPPEGTQVLEVRDAAAAPVWAAHRGEAVYVLEAAELRQSTSLGRQMQFGGSGFVLKALRTSDGSELWRLAWPPEAVQSMAPPQRAGGLWLLRSTQAGRVRLAGVDLSTGKLAFVVELEPDQRPAPTVLLVRGGRVVLGYDGRVVALQATASAPSSPDDTHGAMVQ